MQKIARYEILRELGRGAMGVVYAAMDPMIGRQVAIKTIRLDTMETAENRAQLTQRLFREAQSAGILSHPGIITIYDMGQEGDETYIVMEYVDGRSLEAVLASGVPQRSATLLSILRQAAAALDYAHGKGIIHRDIKPSNIMIAREQTVKIADFGIAKLSASSSMTQSGLILGTPSYMSPEQAQGLALDGRSDQFSLAVVAYRVLTGDLPFKGSTLTALLTKILLEEPNYESAGLHPLLQDAFKKALAKSPQLRYPACAEFVRDLEASYALGREQSPAIALAPEMQEAAASTSESPAEIQPAAEPISIFQEAVPAPIQDLPASGTPFSENKITFASEDSRPPETVSRAPKRIPVRPALAAGLALMVLVAAFIYIHKSQQEKPSAEGTRQIAAGVPAGQQVEETAPAPAAKEAAAAMPSQARLPETMSDQSQQEPADTRKVARSVRTTPKPKRKEESAAPPPKPVSGVIRWSGNLEKNAVLVIDSLRASIGAVDGELPGRPVSIEVDPKEIVIRRMPDQSNAWKLIMLYSGSKKYNSITIHWKAVQ